MAHVVEDDQPTDRFVVALAVAAGIAAGFQIGKVPPSIASIQASFDADLVTMGWIISVFNLVAVFFGIASGIVADRLGSRNLVSFGVLVLVLGATAGSLADNATQLILSRVVSGFGLVSIAVAAPRLIVAVTRLEDRSLALGIWGTYTPAGMALGMVVAPLLLDGMDWRGLWLSDALTLLVFLFIFLRSTRGRVVATQPTSHPQSRVKEISRVVRHAGPWLLGILFALYAIQYFAVMNWLPTFLQEALDYPPKQAAFAAAVVVACNALGNILAAGLLHRGARRWLLQSLALVIMSACGLGIYPESVASGWKYPLALLFSTAGGMLPAATLAASAVHAPTTGQVATVNGVIVQCTNLGSLSGPPLMAMIVTAYGGWSQAWKLLLVCGLLGMLCIAWINRIERAGHLQG